MSITSPTSSSRRCWYDGGSKSHSPRFFITRKHLAPRPCLRGEDGHREDYEPELPRRRAGRGVSQLYPCPSVFMPALTAKTWTDRLQGSTREFGRTLTEHLSVLRSRISTKSRDARNVDSFLVRFIVLCAERACPIFITGAQPPFNLP
jgi:hypothetical protein